ncbi:MAG: ATP-binding protein [Myxococcales bacterium]|nr:ATP-binding protein [Myxococcota bacterium]MDW8281210.1 ATP-binding protein [Myxococcales bacterium]
MQARVTLQLRARLEERKAAEMQLRALCQLRGHPPPLCDQLISAFIEAFNNVVLHAYRDRTDGQVEVVLQLDDDAAVIELSDHGQNFDPQAVPPPVLDGELSEGGYGLHIIRSLMSEVSYHQEGERNVLRMTKHLRLTTDSPKASI